MGNSKEYEGRATASRFGPNVAALEPDCDRALPGIAPQPSVRVAIDRIDREMIQLFALVGEGVAGATDSLLSGDRETARVLADSDEMIDILYREIETLTQRSSSTAHRARRRCATSLRSCACFLSSSGAETWPSTSQAGRCAVSAPRCRTGPGDWSSGWVSSARRCGG